MTVIKGDLVPNTTDTRYNIVLETGQLMYSSASDAQITREWNANPQSRTHADLWQELQVRDGVVQYQATTRDEWVRVPCIPPHELQAFITAATALKRGEVIPVIDEAEQVLMRRYFELARNQCPALIG